MPMHWISDREYITVSEEEEENSMTTTDKTPNNGWSPRYHHLDTLAMATGDDLDGAYRIVTENIATWVEIVKDYQEHLAREDQKKPLYTQVREAGI